MCLFLNCISINRNPVYQEREHDTIMKKIITLVLLIAVCLTAFFSVSAYADTETVKIIVSSSNDGKDLHWTVPETYTAFKIFDVSKDSPNLGDTNRTSIANQSAETAAKGVYYFLPADSPWIQIAKNSEVKAYLTFSGSDASGYWVGWNLYDETNNPNGKEYSEASAIELAEILNGLLHAVKDGDTITGYYVGDDESNVLSEGHTPRKSDAPSYPTDDTSLFVEGDYYSLYPASSKQAVMMPDGSHRGLSNTIHEIPIGYYMITSGLGANLILATTDIRIEEKNTYPTLDKEITHTSDDTEETMNAPGNPWDVQYGFHRYNGNLTGAQVGDTVYFKLTTDIPAEVNHRFELHDTMDPGFTLVLGENAFTVKKTVNEETVEVPSDNGNNWFVQYAADPDILPTTGTGSQAGVTASTAGEDGSYLRASSSSKDSFVVVFTEDYLKGLNLRADGYDATFTVEFDAVLNMNAKTAYQSSYDNRNSVRLVYANYEVSSSVSVESYYFEIAKFAGQSDGSSSGASTLLPGAKFKLYRDTQVGADGKLIDGAVPVAFIPHPQYPGYYLVADGVTELGEVTPVTELTSTMGAFHLEGLDAGDYYLEETEAPQGYNPLTHMVKINGSEVVDSYYHPGGYVYYGSRIYVSDSVTETDGVVTYHMPDDPLLPFVVLAPTNPSDPSSPMSYYYGGVGIGNQTGTVLPITGGSGTAVFYMIGSVLLLGAGLIPLAYRKRRAA